MEALQVLEEVLLLLFNTGMVEAAGQQPRGQHRVLEAVVVVWLAAHLALRRAQMVGNLVSLPEARWRGQILAAQAAQVQGATLAMFLVGVLLLLAAAAAAQAAAKQLPLLTSLAALADNLTPRLLTAAAVA